MNSTEVSALLKSLLDQKSAILNKTREFRVEQKEKVVVADESDAVSGLINENISLHLYEKDRRTLLEIERALGKISAGTYGQCESCECEIGKRRLEVHPFSTLCVSCMEEQENHIFQ